MLLKRPPGKVLPNLTCSWSSFPFPPRILDSMSSAMGMSSKG